MTSVYEKIPSKPDFRFFGDVEFGRTSPTTSWLERYDAVLYAVGAQTDRRLGIPGEDLPGIVAGDGVRRLVQRPPRLPGARVRPRRRARGRGRERNVAIDVARMLALTADELQPTDTAETAVEAIVGSGLQEIVILGRRGPAQAAFTNPS